MHLQSDIIFSIFSTPVPRNIILIRLDFPRYSGNFRYLFLVSIFYSILISGANIGHILFELVYWYLVPILVIYCTNLCTGIWCQYWLYIVRTCVLVSGANIGYYIVQTSVLVFWYLVLILIIILFKLVYLCTGIWC